MYEVFHSCICFCWIFVLHPFISPPLIPFIITFYYAGCLSFHLRPCYVTVGWCGESLAILWVLGSWYCLVFVKFLYWAMDTFIATCGSWFCPVRNNFFGNKGTVGYIRPSRPHSALSYICMCVCLAIFYCPYCQMLTAIPFPESYIRVITIYFT